MSYVIILMIQNYFFSKLFSNLYLAKFFSILAKSVFPCMAFIFINTSNFPKSFSSKLILALFANYLQMLNSRMIYLLTARRYVYKFAKTRLSYYRVRK